MSKKFSLTTQRLMVDRAANVIREGRKLERADATYLCDVLEHVSERIHRADKSEDARRAADERENEIERSTKAWADDDGLNGLA